MRLCKNKRKGLYTSARNSDRIPQLPRRTTPHIVRKSTLLITAVASLLLAPAASAGALNAAEKALLGEMNRARAAHGRAPLQVDARLQRAARSHTNDMFRRGYFAHGSFSRRVQAVRAKGPRLGENLAWASGDRASPQRIVAMWLASPPHRANLLRPGFRRVGLGARYGPFAGRPNAIVVTANFAGR
jgi:uncharacterized protein YkwD